MQNVYQILSK